MFLNKRNQNQITLRNYKLSKYAYKANLIKKYLITQEYLLFYYYDFISTETQQQLSRILLDSNLKALKIKKNSLKTFFENNELDFLKRLLINNVFIIFSNVNENLNMKLVQKTFSLKNIHFIGILLKKKFLRPSELKKLYLLSKENSQKITSKLLNYNKSLLKNILVFKKIS
jgi:hypothetical protein